jgi:hypothetical protein
MSVKSEPRGITIGRTMAGALRTAWRRSPSSAGVSADAFIRCVDRLLSCGCAALAWRRVRDTPAGRSAALESLRQAARTYAIRAAVSSRQIAELTQALRAAGTESLLFKGWAAARLYADPALRPFGDLDLYVRAADSDVARGVMRRFPAGALPSVDLHTSLPDLPDRNPEEALGRSGLVPLNGVEIRVLCPEDHLRSLALHFFRHGGARPLSLCDIGAALESIDAGFDWEYCLRGDPRLTDRVVRATGLAAALLGARIPSPMATRAQSLPGWLMRAVLRQWGAPSYDHYVNRPLIESLRHRGERIPALRRRWPSAIQLAMDRGAPIARMPPLGLQLSDTFSRAVGFARRAWGWDSARERGK